MGESVAGEERHGLPDAEELAEQVKGMIEKLGEERGANIVASVNLGATGTTSVTSKQRIVQRDGKTETTTERTEKRSQ